MLVLLICAHVVATLLAAFVLAYTETLFEPGLLPETAALTASGVLLAQIGLLACWAAFANQPWQQRIVRFLLLCTSFLLAGFLGNYLYEGSSSRMLVEELSAIFLLNLIPPIADFSAWRLITGRRFIRNHFPPGEPPRFQFSIRTLLFLMAELAAILAVSRVVLGLHRGSWDEFLTAGLAFLRERDPRFFAAVIMLPIVHAGLARRGRIWWRAFLAVYLGGWSLFTCYSLTAEHFRFRNPTASQWWQELAQQLIPATSPYLAAAGTIFLTFWLIHRIGYDFRRLDEEPRGGNPPKSRSSAASSSA
jgi:hypothetical protein